MSAKKKSSSARPLVGILMGSISDWETMQYAAKVLADFGIAHEAKVLSAHRGPKLVFDYAGTAEARGLRCIIAGAGCAAHLAGVTASMTVLPVLGVPMESKALGGMDSLLSTVQMPGGIPVATFAIGRAGATNAALFAVQILAESNRELVKKLKLFREAQTAKMLESQPPVTS